MFRTFTWDESNYSISNIPPATKGVIMKLYAHCDILRDQLHPTKGNPPLIPLPHLRENHVDKFNHYINLKMFNNAMMKQAKKMQEKMKVAQEEIAKMETEGSSGGIKIKMLGGKTVEDVEISDKLFEQKDKSLLEKFIKDAVNDASNKADKVTQKKMKKVTGGIKIPGLF